MDVVRDVAALRERLDPKRRAGRSIGLVPTMGALHEGHVSLVRRMVADCEVGVVSIFVNPLQFRESEDFSAYPRDLDWDLELLRREGVAVVFAPEAAEFTPPDRTTTVHVADLSEHLEGASRPGHFDGVATVVCKLVNAVGCDHAYFSEKDFQQLAVVQRMTADLDLPVKIVACPFLREPDGLAMSSRNAYLSTTERQHALALSSALRRVAEGWTGDADWARETLRGLLGDAPGVRLDYAEIVDPQTLKPLHGTGHPEAQALVAAFVGAHPRRTRLIDNARLSLR